MGRGTNPPDALTAGTLSLFCFLYVLNLLSSSFSFHLAVVTVDVTTPDHLPTISSVVWYVASSVCGEVYCPAFSSAFPLFYLLQVRLGGVVAKPDTRVAD